MAASCAASVADHSKEAPQRHEPDGSPTWVTRGTNFVVAITQASPGCRLVSASVPDEHMVLLPDTGARIEISGDIIPVQGYTLAIVPRGDSVLVADSGGWIVRCYSARYETMLGLAGNAADFAVPASNVAPLTDWPAPPGDFVVRRYDLREALRQDDSTRCFRSSNMMINILRERTEPRDVKRLSPHAHADFEQASIALSGAYVHHLRTPWGPDMTQWRPDQAIGVGSPSVVVIPPTVIHTSRNIAGPPALLVDLFCPPRLDFALRPGMVRNANDYPLPPTSTER